MSAYRGSVAIITTRVLIATPLGLLIGISLGALGGGGSILAVPALVYGAGEGAKAATTSSLVVVGATSLVGMGGHLRAGRVRLGAGLAFGLAGVGGSFLGSLLNRHIPGDALLLAFSGLILVAAWRMRAHRAPNPALPVPPTPAVPVGPEAGPLATNGVAAPAATTAVEGDAGAAGGGAIRSTSRFTTVVRVLLAGSAVGFLTGFFGVGGGFVIVPALVLVLGYDMPVAVGTSLLVIAISSAEGLLFRLGSESIDWRIVVPFTVAAVIGVVLGNGIAGRVSAARLTRWFVWLLAAVALYTGVESVLALLRPIG